MLKDFRTDKWNGEKIIIYGAGNDGKIIANKFNQCGIYNYAFCDSYKKGGFLMGKAIYSPNILQNNSHTNIILGSSKYYVDIYKR